MSTLEELERRATPGPWTATRADGWGEAGFAADDPDYDALNDRVYGWWLDGPAWADESGEFRSFTPENAAFIAAIRNVTPELLAVVAAARDICDATPDDGWKPLREALAALDAKDGAS